MTEKENIKPRPITSCSEDGFKCTSIKNDNWYEIKVTYYKDNMAYISFETDTYEDFKNFQLTPDSDGIKKAKAIINAIQEWIDRVNKVA
jgi:hypothetical protein